jgi:hypothetical protein
MKLKNKYFLLLFPLLFCCEIFAQDMDCYTNFFSIDYLTLAEFSSKQDTLTAKKITYRFSPMFITRSYDKIDTIFNIISIDTPKEEFPKCFSYTYDSTNRALNILHGIDSIGMYWLSEAKAEKMYYLNDEMLTIGDNKYAVRKFSDKKITPTAYKELFISKKDNTILKILYYNIDGKINDSLSLIFLQKFNFSICTANLHSPLDTNRVNIQYRTTFVDEQLWQIAQSYRMEDRKYTMSSYLFSIYQSTFKKNKDGIYKVIQNNNSYKKDILCYSFSETPILRDYYLPHTLGDIQRKKNEIFEPIEQILMSNNPFSKALIVSYLGKDTIEVSGKLRECYYFQENPNFEFRIFDTLECYAKVDIWIDVETLVLCKQIIWISSKEAKDNNIPWALYRKDEFVNLLREDFFIKVLQN